MTRFESPRWLPHCVLVLAVAVISTVAHARSVPASPRNLEWTTQAVRWPVDPVLLDPTPGTVPPSAMRGDGPRACLLTLQIGLCHGGQRIKLLAYFWQRSA